MRPADDGHLPMDRLAADALSAPEAVHVHDCIRCRMARLRVRTLVASDAATVTYQDGPVGSDEPTAALSARELPSSADRYEDLGLLGAGGLGEVRRVHDRVLNRVVAMKLIRTDAAPTARDLSRFYEEAQVGGQLQHPGLVPVYDLGVLPDGRPFFTMREIEGRTLADVIDEVHAASPSTEWGTGATGWTFHRLMEAFARVCEAIAYAHARGVVHRDLKPLNVVVGRHGEILVIDWGLAKLLGTAADTDDVGIVSRRETGDPHTQDGSVLGTPAYMPPEQAWGEVPLLDQRADVYSLGAILYHILSGHPPYEGRNARSVVLQVRAGPPPPPGRAVGPGALSTLTSGEDDPGGPAEPSGPPLPQELVSACLEAMARDRHERFAEGGALAAAVSSWLEGTRRREQALELVAHARSVELELEAMAGHAHELREEASLALSAVSPAAPEDQKAAAWEKQDSADTLEHEAELRRFEVEEVLRNALTMAPDLAEAHGLLADLRVRQHEAAVASGDRVQEARAEAALRVHVASAPPAVQVRLSPYLRGDGALTLVTDPEGAEVDLYRYVERTRRLVPVLERRLGPTPLRGLSLEMGSWLCVIHHPGCADVRYPVRIGRGEHWDGVPPGEREAQPVALPVDLPAADCYVPAGWCVIGEDRPEVRREGFPLRRVWCDGLVVRRYPVTHREYLAFLNSLLDYGLERDGLRYRPDEGGYQRVDGRYRLPTEADPDLADTPVTGVDWECADAYTEWLGREGLPWRLPGELEWEKAARGVDGRRFPWGNRFDPSWCCSRDGSSGGRVQPVTSHPVDESVFGVRGMAGNVHEWCLSTSSEQDLGLGRVRVHRPMRSGHGSRIVRGGSASEPEEHATCSARWSASVSYRVENLGFRVVRSWPPAPR